MRNISLIAAGVVALGWGAARGETAPPSPTTNVDVNTPGTNVDVNTPGGNVAVNVNPPPAPTTDANAAAISGATVEPAPVEMLPPLPAPESERIPAPRPWAYRMGGGFFVGGGFDDFTNNNLRSMTTGAGYWSARVVAGTRQIVGAEAAYIGDARNIDTLGLSSNARLISNGVEGAVRLNVPIVSQDR